MTAKERKHFNTSHVVVYPARRDPGTLRFTFQYISCCSLSISGKRIALTCGNFNTSHVVVYRRIELEQKKSTPISIHLML